MDLTTPLAKVAPVFRIKGKLLEKLGLQTVQDLLFYTPFRYDANLITSKIGLVQPGETVTIQGDVISAKNVFTRGRLTIQRFEIEDETGVIEATFFNQRYLMRAISVGARVSMAGRVERFGGRLKLAVRAYEVLNSDGSAIHTTGLVPVYSETRGLTSKWIRGRIKTILDANPEIPDFLPDSIKKKNNFETLSDAIYKIHFPKTYADAELARKRLSFDELFLKHAASLTRKKEWEEKEKTKPFEIKKFEKQVNKLLKSLPFELTNAQKKAIEDIEKDLDQTTPMNRLLEGDVGSGKTVVAAIAAYIAYLNGFQVALMAPTEILANQHFNTIKTILESFGVKVQLFTSSNKKNSKSSMVNSKSFDIAVGTHALVHGKVKFDKLGLVIIDEQQRFGVSQRAILRDKGENPHLLTMTATPIPRTIFLTIYADLAISFLDELPKGRKKIKTHLVPEEKRENGYKWIANKVKTERSQVFIVCPFIEPSESMTTVKAAKDEFERLQKEVFPHLKLGLLHGKMKKEEKDKVIELFRNGKLDILVATPVIEVGIDIPTADIMLIEAAERFGLAQLHQLRGRVGRGSKESYCLLFTGSQSDTTKERLGYLQTIDNGAKLAEVDLKLRGPGEMFGTAQHGIPDLKIASLSDFPLFTLARNEAEKIYKDLNRYPELKQKIEETETPKISKD